MVLPTTVSTAPFYASRPLIDLDGEERQDLSLGLLTMVVTETVDGLYACEASFGNWGTRPDGSIGTLYDDRSLLDFGKSLVISCGDGDANGVVFNGRIMGLEAHFPQVRPPEIIVLAEDRLQDLRMARRTRTFEAVSDSDVMEQIASEHGLQVDVDIDGPTYRVLAQVNQSDLAFLRSRARSCDVELWVEDRTLYARKRSARGSTPIPLIHGQTLIEFSVLADIARQRTNLAVGGWDVGSKETVVYEASQSAIQNELNGLESGAQILEQALGERVETIVHQMPMTSQEAQALAEAHFRRQARQFLTGSGIVDGDARIRVGTVLALSGLGNMFSGDYYVTEAQHQFEGTSGYRTRFRVERAGL